MAKKEFTADSKLGFMRVIQVINILYITTMLVFMLFVRGATVPVDGQIVITLFQIIAMSVTVWLIGNRKMYSRQIIICLLASMFLMWQVLDAVSGTWSLISAAADLALVYLPMMLYFAFSRRAKAVLVQPFNIAVRDKRLAEERKMWDLKSPDFWKRLAIYFFIFSIAGHWMEMGLQFFIVHGWFPGTVAGPDSLTWRDSFNPFPIYGIAVVVCGLALYPAFLKLRDKLPKAWMAFVVSFLLNTLFCTVAELLLGFAFNADHSAWDYSDQFLNFEGQICFLYTFAFGVVSSLITWQLYPLMERQFSYMSRDMFRMFFAISAVVYAIIFITYNIDPNVMFGQEVDIRELQAESAATANTAANVAANTAA